MVECARILPECASNVSTIGATTTVQDDAQNDEADDSKDLDNGEDELGLSITFDTKQVDRNDENKEDGHPGVVVDCSFCPVINGQSSGDDFQRKNDEPL